ncbi:CotY/CotZ family spore coat protein [Neobacillus sp. D3-1R]|uniref:CotY/CotZ family spore coat protein n=1 Tax=Neobacillus sp. D3-1R TaxID=3445778 RepID=UPI003F9FAD38
MRFGNYKYKDHEREKHWHLDKHCESSDHHHHHRDESSEHHHHHHEESSSSSSHEWKHESSSSSSNSSHETEESSSSHVWDQSKDLDHGNTKHQQGCVEDVLKAILHAQKKAKKDKECCDTSCKGSIQELLGEKNKVKKNTIPFILYCGGCEPFKATGVKTYCSRKSNEEKFACITSFIFKVKKVKNGCAVLELLTFKQDKSHMGKDSSHDHSPCNQIHCRNVNDLKRSGICITVDLSCICAITCLPAVYL